MSRLCCAGPPFEPFDGGLKRITTDRATGACRGSRGHWPGFSPAGILKDGVFPSPNRPQSLHSLNLMSEPHLPSGPELCPKPAPPFCSRCRKSFSGSFGLAICPTCGDRLIPEGYCSVCEDYWTLPVGVPCPKHDLPLDALGPPRLQFEVLGKPARWVTVCHFTDSLAAQAPRIRLEAEGIPTFVDGERMGSRSMYHVATGGVRLMVPDSLAPDGGSSFRKPGRPWPRSSTSRQSMRMNRSRPSRKATPKPSATPCRYAKALCSSSPSDCQPCF